MYINPRIEFDNKPQLNENEMAKRKNPYRYSEYLRITKRHKRLIKKMTRMRSSLDPDSTQNTITEEVMEAGLIKRATDFDLLSIFKNEGRPDAKR